jgi:L-arabinonolactonase
MRALATLALDARAEAGESPWWLAAEQKLCWVDIHGRLIHRFDPASGIDERWAVPDVVSFVAPHRDGGWIAALGDRIVYAQHFGGPLRTLFRLAVPDGGRLNDGAVDARGRLWIGAMSPPDAEQGGAALYRIDHDGTYAAVFDGFRTVNGLAFSPDGKTMYVSDSHPAVRTIWRCDYSTAEGLPRNRTVFVDTRDLPGRPDGGCVDEEGAYWMAAVDGACVLRLSHDGEVTARIDLPVEKPSKAVFGGADLDVLFITSLRRRLHAAPESQPHAGGIFEARTGVRGCAATPCAIGLGAGSVQHRALRTGL